MKRTVQMDQNWYQKLYLKSIPFQRYGQSKNEQNTDLQFTDPP